MKIIFVGTLILLLGVTSGCANKYHKKTEGVMQSWMGKHESVLIEQWGPPQREARDGKGGRVLVYSSRYQLAPSTTTDIDLYGNLRQVDSQGATREVSRMFYVDTEGNIYSYKWRN